MVTGSRSDIQAMFTKAGLQISNEELETLHLCPAPFADLYCTRILEQALNKQTQALEAVSAAVFAPAMKK